MKAKWTVALAMASILGVGIALAWADDLPENATFTTFIITPLAIEGLTGDAGGNLYTTGRAAVPTPCPVWRIDPSIPSLVQIGSIPNSPTACNPSGIAFDQDDNIYIADANLGGVIWRLTQNADGTFTSPTANSDAFATGVPGTNGIAFDEDGNLWTGDGTTGQGRVWKMAPCALPPCSVTEVFRVQPMANVLDPALSGSVSNVGRDARTLPPGTIDANRAATNTLGSQPLVANGLAFTHEGDLFVADTARGAIWKVEFDSHGNLESPTGCDTTFPANTLCLDNILIQHPYLEGVDGIALDQAGNIWASANERNAIVVVTKDGAVVEIFRNPVNTTTGLRNANPTVGNNHILEFPTSPFLSGKTFYTSNSDGDRRDNSPRAAGEINAGGAVGTRGKISRMDQNLKIPGLPLPVD